MKTKPAYAFLEAQSIYLRPFLPSDEAYLAIWCNDRENRNKTGSSRPVTPIQIQASFANDKPDAICLAIVTKADDRIIGETGLLRMFSDWGCSDLSIMIYDEHDQHRGYGQQAIHCMLNYAFGDLHFHRIAIGVVAFNHTALAFYEKIGFKKEGIQEEGYYHDYQYHDFIMMRILKQEYINHHK